MILKLRESGCTRRAYVPLFHLLKLAFSAPTALVPITRVFISIADLGGRHDHRIVVNLQDALHQQIGLRDVAKLENLRSGLDKPPLTIKGLRSWVALPNTEPY